MVVNQLLINLKGLAMSTQNHKQYKQRAIWHIYRFKGLRYAISDHIVVGDSPVAAKSVLQQFHCSENLKNSTAFPEYVRTAKGAVNRNMADKVVAYF